MLKIDAEDLSMALESHSDYEAAYFLNTETGAIEFVAFENPEYGLLAELQIESVDDLPEKYLQIDAVESRVALGIMQDFVETVQSENIAHGLADALAGKRPFRSFQDTLLDYPAERKQWFQYRDVRFKQLAQEWLRDNNIQAELIERLIAY